MDILKSIQMGELKMEYPGLKLELYLIYEEGIPVSGAGLFFSKERNFAYLHDAGTLERYRGKGYQSDLIRYRVNRALEEGIDRIYSSVDYGSKSWANCIQCGLIQLHTAHGFIK
jgi:GNAT superfamily N-acetyltransferase